MMTRIQRLRGAATAGALLSVALLAAPRGVLGQLFRVPPRATVATLPAASVSNPGRIYSVTDGANATDCTTGGGSSVVLCIDKGAAGWAATAAAGSGTVMSASVTTANGVSATVANPTTTPAFTFTLGAITPSSVAATGNVTGANLSGTNTGDQTSITGNAATATALAANPDNCPTPGDFAVGIAASGAAECATPASGGVTDHGALTGLSDDDHSQYTLAAGRAGGQAIVGSISGSVPLRLFGYAGAGGGVSVIFGESGAAWGVSGLTGTGMYSRRCTNADCTTSSLDMHLRAARFSATTSGGFEHFSIIGGDTENAPTSPAGAVGGSGTCLSFGDSATVTFSSAWTSICRQAQGVVKWPASREIPQSAPPYACDATTRGTTYYDSGDDDFCDCVGAGWRSRGGAGACS